MPMIAAQGARRWLWMRKLHKHISRRLCSTPDA